MSKPSRSIDEFRYGPRDLQDQGLRSGALRARMSLPGSHESVSSVGPSSFALSLSEASRIAREERASAPPAETHDASPAAPAVNPYASQWDLLSVKQRAAVGLHPYVRPGSYAATETARAASAPADPFHIAPLPTFED